MAEVLVFAEHAGGTVKKVTLELLTLARQSGEPAAVWTGPGAADGQARLAGWLNTAHSGCTWPMAAISPVTWPAPRPSCWRPWFGTSPR